MEVEAEVEPVRPAKSTSLDVESVHLANLANWTSVNVSPSSVAIAVQPKPAWDPVVATPAVATLTLQPPVAYRPAKPASSKVGSVHFANSKFANSTSANVSSSSVAVQPTWYPAAATLPLQPPSTHPSLDPRIPGPVVVGNSKSVIAYCFGCCCEC